MSVVDSKAKVAERQADRQTGGHTDRPKQYALDH